VAEAAPARRARVAAEIAASMVALVQRAGFREDFDPFTGAGYGSHDFSWTGALLVDLLCRQAAGARRPVGRVGLCGSLAGSGRL